MDGPEKKNIQKNKIPFPSTYDGEFIKINSLVEGAREIKTHGGGMSELVNIKCMYFMDGSEQKNVNMISKKTTSTMENLLSNMEEGSHKIEVMH